MPETAIYHARQALSVISYRTDTPRRFRPWLIAALYEFHMIGCFHLYQAAYSRRSPAHDVSGQATVTDNDRLNNVHSVRAFAGGDGRYSYFEELSRIRECIEARSPSPGADGAVCRARCYIISASDARDGDDQATTGQSFFIVTYRPRTN